MYNEILNKLKYYNDAKKFVDDKFVIDISEIVKEQYKLSYYVKKFKINNKLNSGGIYESSKKLITYNPEFKHNPDLKEMFPDYYYFLYNISIVLGIFHELYHVKQFKTVMDELYLPDEEKNMFLFLFLSIESFCKKQDDINKTIENYYNLNHDKDPFERDANLSSMKYLFKLFSIMPNDEKEVLLSKTIFQIQKYIILTENYILNGEKTNSPSLDYINNIPIIDTKEILDEFKDLINDPNLSYDDRLHYGLWLTNNEFVELNIHYQDKINDLFKILKK